MPPLARTAAALCSRIKPARSPAAPPPRLQGVRELKVAAGALLLTMEQGEQEEQEQLLLRVLDLYSGGACVKVRGWRRQGLCGAAPTAAAPTCAPPSPYRPRRRCMCP